MKSSPLIYRFKVISDSYTEPGTVWRVIEIPDNRTLSTLNKAICDAYDRWNNQLWSFHFGQSGKRGTKEYVTYKDKRRFGRKTISGHEAKLKFLPLNDHKLFYYQWSYEQQWWHRIEFLGTSDIDPAKKYPAVTEPRGDVPPVHIDLFQRTLQQLQLVSDLQLEMQGFRRGLDLGNSDPDHLDAVGMHALTALIKADAILDGMREFNNRNPDSKPEQIKKTLKLTLEMAATIDTVMLHLAMAFRKIRKRNIDKLIN